MSIVETQNIASHGTPRQGMSLLCIGDAIFCVSTKGNAYIHISFSCGMSFNLSPWRITHCVTGVSVVKDMAASIPLSFTFSHEE